MDVGLAQARQPLTTRCHYYEVEIVDAGEKCYIALGLARRVSFLRKEQLLTFLHLHSLFFSFFFGGGGVQHLATMPIFPHCNILKSIA